MGRKKPKMGRKKQKMGRKKQKEVVIMGAEEIRERALRYKEKYIDYLMKSQGFDVCGLPPQYYGHGLIVHYCDDRSPCCDLVLLYARLGLHRYNFLQGIDLQLSRVNKYNRTEGIYSCMPRSYYITLEAAATAGSLQTFQARVNEQKYDRFVLSCTIARIKGDTKKQIDGENENDNVLGEKFLVDFMPKLPLENPFKDDTTRFYVLKESELQDNDWIRLYLELAVATTNRESTKTHSLTNLKILEVVMESTRDLSPFTKGLGAYDAIFYIRYQDSCEARVGKDFDRIAIVRRIVNDQFETFHLVDLTQSSQTIIPSPNGTAAMEAGSSCAQV